MAEVTEPYDFYIGVLEEGDDGTLSLSEAGYVNLEDTFSGLRYESYAGIEKRGKTRNYEETWAESDEALVYVPSGAERDVVETTLTLYFFDPMSWEEGRTNAERIGAVLSLYEGFLSFVEGRKFIYCDTVRGRKSMLYLDGAVSPKTMTLKGGIPYYEVAFSMKSVYGHPSIPISEVYGDVSGDISVG